MTENDLEDYKFTLPTIAERHAIFKENAMIHSKVTLNTTSSKVLIYMLCVSPNPVFTLLHFVVSHFQVIGHSEASMPSDVKMILTTRRSRSSVP